MNEVPTLVPALAALALVTVVFAALIGYETIRYRYVSRIASVTGGRPADPSGDH